MTREETLKKIYSSANGGTLGRGSRQVTVNGKSLADIEQIGFTWGYAGRRDRNLAHSIMADYFEDPNVPRSLWMLFYEDVLEAFSPSEEWDITGQMITEWIYRLFPEEQQEYVSPPEEERREELKPQRHPQNQKPEPVASSRPLYTEPTFTPVSNNIEDDEEFDDDDEEEELEDELE